MLVLSRRKQQADARWLGTDLKWKDSTPLELSMGDEDRLMIISQAECVEGEGILLSCGVSQTPEINRVR